ncbi:NAD-dependent epimerase/dehydratase family protein [Rhodoplanes sp. Z2-YC6860]|uniref:NAD-dependent epimerase/dehydratase family protein n=1 Tax=Rhodoplanes sp. Z2-YC6860 TaxID=674703 RepID=UPI00078CD542|nr:NAD-dependent epimerase/dehydratase family protein [Rhodoplanes sp. Z2-YC6860]AMN43440.1 NAD dependent epimerase/dehydratase family protein [Rhodoplanes sp. Z2-YC6860]
MNLANRRVVVTGGAGLIGSFLAERLVAAGAQVIVADDFSKGRRDYLAKIADRIEIREGDLEEQPAMERALANAEVVLHLASRAFGVGYSAGNHLSILDHNERITGNLIRVLARKPAAWLLVASSSCVYPDDGPDTITELPLFSGEPEMANWGYGWAKRMLEQKALMLAKEIGMPLTVVRPFNIYGERYTWSGDASQAIPMQVKKVMDGDNPVVIWGSGTQRRNYLHAVDCADAMAGLVEAGFKGVVNIGTEETVTLRELAETICRVAGRHPHLIADASKPEGRRIKSADSTLLRKSYPGFRRTVSLEQGIVRMIEWYAGNFGGKVA